MELLKLSEADNKLLEKFNPLEDLLLERESDKKLKQKGKK